LQALTDLIQLANSSANSDRADAQVLIRADVEQNSFDYDLIIAILILRSESGIKTAGELLDIIVTFIELMKMVRGSPKDGATCTRHPDGKVEVYCPPHTPMRISKDGDIVVGFYNTPKMKNRALKMLSPLRKDGYDRMRFSRGDDVILDVEKSDLPAEDGSDLPDLGDDQIKMIRTRVEIRRAVYKGDSPWGLIYDGRTYPMKISDEEWLARFQSRRERVPPGSLLDVNLEEAYVTDGSGKVIGKPSYRVIKVYDVILPVDQLNLEFAGESSSSPEGT